MAASENKECQYLRLLFECLATRINRYRPELHRANPNMYRFLRGQIHQTIGGHQLMFQLYGSIVEELYSVGYTQHAGSAQCTPPDCDFMVFPMADDLMILDEMLEYLPDNPLHVRIRAADHPVLQSCIVENTEYLSTSSVKNFHPAIYCEDPLKNLDEALSTYAPFFSFSPVENSVTSPALTFNVAISTSKIFTSLDKMVKQSLERESQDKRKRDLLSLQSAIENAMVEDCTCFQFIQIDYIPSLRSQEWPKVAQEWIKRERKWPSPDIIDKVIQEGFHLVVKAPKNGGNAECDFRISFSHAEYLLSQQMNEIQRECFLCIKEYHRAYLSTEPKCLVTFHLKNVFLQTIEETGAEMWTESNRAECMMKLFRNLLEALRKKNLPHYFVKSYNMFCTDYIQDPKILESLATKVEKFMENPAQFAVELILYDNPSITREQEGVTNSKCTSSAKGQGQMDLPSKQLIDELVSLILWKRRKHQAKALKEAVMKELTDMAFNNADCSLEDVDPLERTLVEDFREIGKKMPFEQFSKFYELLVWGISDVCNPLKTNINTRDRLLSGIQFLTQILKCVTRAASAPRDHFLSILKRMIDPAADDPIDWSFLMPPGLEDLRFPQLCLEYCIEFYQNLFQLQESDTDDIPLD